MTPPEREKIVDEVMECMDCISVSDDAERIVARVIAPLLAETKSQTLKQAALVMLDRADFIRSSST